MEILSVSPWWIYFESLGETASDSTNGVDYSLAHDRRGDGCVTRARQVSGTRTLR